MADTQQGSTKKTADCDVVVIGAGFAGIYALRRASR